MDFVTGHVGWIEVICGPMFSGKSEELIRRLRRALIARKRVQVFKPALDVRYSADEIVSHADSGCHREVIRNSSEILRAGLAHAGRGDRRGEFHGASRWWTSRINWRIAASR